MPSIFSNYSLGELNLKNRIVMAPMTRARAADYNPDDLTALYYSQRAGAGLIVTEGLPISQEARGAPAIPGIYTAEQVRRWREVTEAVHAAGGLIFAQIWHVGRASHVQMQIGAKPPVSSVDTQANAITFGLDENGTPGQIPQSKARALRLDEIPRVIDDYVVAARNAAEAGFDGIEIHGANGYLPEQFINGALNTRADAYGGSIENRIRFPIELVEAVSREIGAKRTAIRLAPFGRFNDMHPFDDEAETWLALAQELSKRDLAYIHISDQETLGAQAIPDGFVDKFRKAYDGTLVVAGGYQLENGQEALDVGRADLIAIGRPFLTNPDLVDRLRNDWPLTPIDPSVFYGTAGAEGYVTYKTFQPEA